MSNHPEWDHPSVVRIRELETAAALFAGRIFNETGDTALYDQADAIRIHFTKMLAPYRRAYVPGGSSHGRG